MPNNLPVEVVRAQDDAYPFIIPTWVMSYRKSKWVEAIPSDNYFSAQRARASNLLSLCQVGIARWTEYPDQYYGWICYDNTNDKLLIHYCYVKEKFRRLGIGKLLLESTGYKDGQEVVATHYPRIADPVKGWLRGRIKVIYDHYALRTL